MRWLWEKVLGFHWHDWKWENEIHTMSNCYYQMGKCKGCGKAKEQTLMWIGKKGSN